jgi:hypothetical protein
MSKTSRTVNAMAKAAKQEDFQDKANEYAKTAIESLSELLEQAKQEDDDQCIQEDPLSIEVRSDWHSIGDTDGNKPTEYNILLTTGGPAARIIGELNQYLEPETARFEFQDWFKPWTEANVTEEQKAIMLEYAQHFYFGE